MLHEPDLARCIQKTFPIGTVLVKEPTASRSRDGTSSVWAETGHGHKDVGPGLPGPAKSRLHHLNNN